MSGGGQLLAISPAGRLRGRREGAGCYRPKNDTCWNRRPARIWSTRASDRDPIRSPRLIFSTEEICDTTTTLCLGRFPSPTSSRTFPGSLARCKFDVSAHTTVVVMREWLKTSNLHHHVGMGVARDRPSRVVRSDPEHVTAVDPHRTRVR